MPVPKSHLHLECQLHGTATLSFHFRNRDEQLHHRVPTRNSIVITSKEKKFTSFVLFRNHSNFFRSMISTIPVKWTQKYCDHITLFHDQGYHFVMKIKYPVFLIFLPVLSAFKLACTTTNSILHGMDSCEITSFQLKIYLKGQNITVTHHHNAGTALDFSQNSLCWR